MKAERAADIKSGGEEPGDKEESYKGREQCVCGALRVCVWLPE